MRRLVVVATLLLVASTIVVGGVQQTPDADNTVTRIAVQADGDAEWTVTVRTRLETDEERRAYEEFQSRFRENTSEYVSPFRTRIEGVVASGANATGREMRAQNVTAATDIRQLPRRWGVVTYSFTWTQFAATDGESLAVGDVFAGGFFIGENDTLVVTTPPEYTLASVEPTPDSRDDETVRWRGQRDFADSRPALRFDPVPGGTTAPADTSDGPPLTPLAGLFALAVAALGVGVYLYYGRDETAGGEPSGAEQQNSESTLNGGPDQASGAAAAASDPTLTDGERVEQLLADNDGRLKQADIAEAFGWSASKTSRVVSQLSDEDRVEKLRIGRENVVSLPEE
ncbi:DUF7345 domain-containing protein [Halosegnis longus]|uniref:DUF7345 domain-containing protein n=1 Tax=Halosegnis longus TaxID=2216012 RepID=UPI00096A4465|nr:hypothetical protein [Salella cibi]